MPNYNSVLTNITYLYYFDNGQMSEIIDPFEVYITDLVSQENSKPILPNVNNLKNKNYYKAKKIGTKTTTIMSNALKPIKNSLNLNKSEQKTEKDNQENIRSIDTFFGKSLLKDALYFLEHPHIYTNFINKITDYEINLEEYDYHIKTLHAVATVAMVAGLTWSGASIITISITSLRGASYYFLDENQLSQETISNLMPWVNLFKTVSYSFGAPLNPLMVATTITASAKNVGEIYNNFCNEDSEKLSSETMSKLDFASTLAGCSLVIANVKSIFIKFSASLKIFTTVSDAKEDLTDIITHKGEKIFALQTSYYSKPYGLDILFCPTPENNNFPAELLLDSSIDFIAL